MNKIVLHSIKNVKDWNEVLENVVDWDICHLEFKTDTTVNVVSEYPITLKKLPKGVMYSDEFWTIVNKEDFCIGEYVGIEGEGGLFQIKDYDEERDMFILEDGYECSPIKCIDRRLIEI